MKEVNFTPLHEWREENEATGTMFVAGDVQSIWETEWEEELGIPLEDVWDELKETWEWRKGIQDLLAEHGFEIISMMCSQYVGEKGFRNGLV